MVSFEAAMRGITKYMDRNIYAGMNDWQEILARTAVGVALGSEENLKNTLMTNGMIKTFCIMDANGNVDIERVASALRAEIQKKGRLTLKLPVFGTFSFAPEDVDELLRTIREA